MARFTPFHLPTPVTIEAIDSMVPKSFTKIKPYLIKRRNGLYKPIYDALSNREQYIYWLFRLSSDVNEKMMAANLPGYQRKIPFINRKYLDEVVIERAKRFGFTLKNNYPIVLRRLESEETFRQHFTRGEIFYDASVATVIPLPNYPGGFIFHGMRSHALQLLYLAEHIDNFIEIYRTMGAETDNEVFHMYLDIPVSSKITNNALFARYVYRVI